MDQTDEPRRATGFQPGQDGGFLQMVVRYQEIDRRLGSLPKSREEPALAAGQGGEAAAPRETPHLAIVCGRIGVAAPDRGDRRNKLLRPIARYQA